MIDDKEKGFCFVVTKVSVLDVLYYSMLIGAGFVCGVSTVMAIAFQIAKLIF